MITRRDTEDAVVMSLDYYNSLMGTVHVLKSPANAEHLAQSIEQFRQGNTQEKITKRMRHLAWTDAAWSDYLYWQSQDRKTLKRINRLIDDAETKNH